ncbi:hypothetical protein [Desulfosporosinus nitroreducens]|uniref:Restriction endonuclease n=1 Tax=Desulfosporosinus nitroreducens TaxID=2018668 RepID=A0ABT8QS04_9FIRM|nr:hypothetical protein [Desulfosporosinus nitroreducens]MDO0824138.1 hypothetical protein [Desulfosporosinus nitroreducens]
MIFIYEYVEQVEELFKKLPVSKNNKKVKEAILAEIVNDYYELKKENMDEEHIKIFKEKHEWIENLNFNDAMMFGVSIDGMTLSEGVEFDTSGQGCKSDRNYQLLEELCDISLCYERRKEDFEFNCSVKFVIFALDKCRDYFGSIEGYCNIEELDVPIGYVRRDGYYGRIANNFKDFLELAVFYPYWNKVIKLERMRIEYSLDKLEQEWIINIPDFYKKQKELSDVLKLNRNEKSIATLFDNLRMESDFFVCVI